MSGGVLQTAPGVRRMPEEVVRRRVAQEIPLECFLQRPYTAPLELLSLMQCPCLRLSQLAITILGRIWLNLQPEVVDAALCPARLAGETPRAAEPAATAAADGGRGPPHVDPGIDESQPGGKAVRFLTDVAGGVLPVSSTEPFTSELAIAALRILRAMHFHSAAVSPWREAVGAFVTAQLATFPTVTSASTLYHDQIRYYCIALHVLTGCPDTLRVGSEVTYAPPNAISERMVVLQCDIGKGRAVCISSEDVSMMSEEKEVLVTTRLPGRLLLCAAGTLPPPPPGGGQRPKKSLCTGN